ncbi:hypothetical protein HBI56_044560 [Parastagonospora nodorum]|nr:hypothetical protein HBH53_168210 [Parastagonospora nodorum]KAH3965428.1 hypothetical protein HBH51_150190 [Parastagonospora nodorum]KAH3977356.1 hypothetical protein HBH52_110710 [Parastagonospora nodorum]KAH3991243.1 hypothetical protein HBI10_236330 [Parastagonospora nodorum]KAH4011837.1 hypothetical protein HBI09_225540 [Parastagonospora nodorum]
MAHDIQLKPILDAQKKHGPIFRRELFDIAYKSWISIEENAPENKVSPEQESSRLRRFLDTKAVVADIYGIKRETSLSRDDYMEEVDKQTYKFKRCWTYHDIQDLGYRYCNNHGNLLPFDIGTRGDPVQEEVEDDTIPPDFHIKAAEFHSDWEASDIHHRLVAFLEEHAGTTTQVDQIICFGLGSPVSSRHPRILRRAYTQHLAACTIRDLFARHQNSPAPKILAQDPRYTPIDMAYLSTHFSTTTLPDPEAFRALNGTTFVISISPDVPVRQVALGMTHDSGGPAGFLCCAIEDNGLGCKSVTMQNGEEVFRFTDNSSPGLWEFKQKGVWAEWDDLEGGEVEDCFGSVGCYLKRK